MSFLIILVILVMCAIVFTSKETSNGVNIVYDYEDEDELFDDFLLIDLLEEEEEEYDARARKLLLDRLISEFTSRAPPTFLAFEGEL